MNKIIKEADGLDDMVSMARKADIPEEEVLSLISEETKAAAKRTAVAEKVGAELTEAQTLRDPKKMVKERELLESVEPESQLVKDFAGKQTEDIKRTLEEGLGFKPKSKIETGELVQKALSKRKEQLGKLRTGHYNRAKKSAKEAGDIKIFDKEIKNAIPDVDTMEDLAIRAETPMKALDKALMKYGLKKPTKEMKKFVPQSITIQNFDKFRKLIDGISADDMTGAVEVAVGPIRRALDIEIDNLGKMGGAPKSVVSELKKGRAIAKERFIEFDPKRTTGKLIATKPKSSEMVIEASNVFDTLTAKGTKIEQLEKTVDSLKKGGFRGKKALDAIQSSTIYDLLDSSLDMKKTVTPKGSTKSTPLFDPAKFKQRVKDIGEDKLAVIFKDNPKTLDAIKNVEEFSGYLIPDIGKKISSETAKATAIRLTLIAASRIMALAPIAYFGATQVATPTAMARKAKKAVKMNKQAMKQISTASSKYPALATAIGTKQILGEENGE
jgi:hypothetical protein